MTIKEEWEKAEKEIFEKVDNVITMLSDIESEYVSWDEWGKNEIVFKARKILLEGFKKELENKYYST